MREYGQVQCSFWGHPDISDLSDGAKLLALYLLTGPHSNGLGCYRLPDGYVQADLGWTSERVSKGFEELSRKGFCNRCERTFFVLLPGYLKWNPISNANVGKAREKEFKEVPSSFSYKQELVAQMLTHGAHWSEQFNNRLETLYQTLSKQDPTRPDPEPDPSPSMSGKSETLERRAAAKRVLTFLNEKTGRNYQPVDANIRMIEARLKEGATETQCRQVIVRKRRDWNGDQKMEQYLRPATLFNQTKFAQYQGELVKPEE